VNASRLERALWTVASLLVLLGVALLRTAPDAAAASAPIVLGPAPALPTADSLLDALAESVEENLFRPERAGFDASKTPAPPALGRPLPASRPQLTLRGLVGGPPWDLLIEGIPGRDGAAVLRVGQTVNGYRVRAVRRDTVIVAGPDTTWKLTLRRQ